jgi:hypothetical protein
MTYVVPRCISLYSEILMRGWQPPLGLVGPKQRPVVPWAAAGLGSRAILPGWLRVSVSYWSSSGAPPSRIITEYMSVSTLHRSSSVTRTRVIRSNRYVAFLTKLNGRDRLGREQHNEVKHQ